MKIQLVPPAGRYRESFLRGLRELRDEGLWWWLSADLDAAVQDFDNFVAGKLADSKRRHERHIARTHLWAVTDQDEFAGRISIRHALDDALRVEGGHISYDTVPRYRRRGVATEMLRQALPLARGIGLTAVLLTCDDSNEASIRVIERNGGLLRETKALDPSKPRKRYYWIALSGGGTPAFQAVP